MIDVDSEEAVFPLQSLSVLSHLLMGPGMKEELFFLSREEEMSVFEHLLCVGNFTYQSVSQSVQSLSRVRLFVTSWTGARQAPLSMGILQARIPEWVAMPSSRGSSQPRDRTRVSNPGLPHSQQILYHLSHQGSYVTYKKLYNFFVPLLPPL